MRWAIKHKSGRTLFVTSDEFIANNRRKMGWIVEEVKMTSRERFEVYAADRLWLPIEMIFDARNGDRYLHAFDSMNVMQPLNAWWTVWQASRSAIEVATPWLCGDGDNDTEWTQGYNDGVMATEKAIISAGLKVKK